MNRRLISFAVFLFLLSLSLPSAQAHSYWVRDGAELMAPEEIVGLEAIAEDVSSSTGLDIVILTVERLDGLSPAAYADDYYDSNGFGDDGMLFMLAMEERDWYISTCGDAIRIFDDDDIDTLLDAGLPWFSDGYYYEGFCEVLRIAGSMMSYDPIPSTASSVSKSGQTLLISLAIGAAVSGIVILIMRSSMNTKRKQRSAADYMTQGSYHLRTRQDIFLYSNVTKTPRQQNSSSGGSSHMASSGRSHGGGGRKF